jgi:cellulose synthase operon protein C
MRQSLPWYTLGLTFLFSTSMMIAQPTADQQAEILLNAALKGQNDKQYTFAVNKYREYLQKFGGHPRANSARLGLGQLLIESPERNLEAAIEAISPAAGAAQFAEQYQAAFLLAFAQKELGLNELAKIPGKSPPEIQQIRQRADARFNEADRWFKETAAILERKVGKLEAIEKSRETEINWMLRAKSEWCEIEIRLNRPKEARTVLDPIIANKTLMNTTLRKQLLYLHGYASFLLQDYLVAGRSLSQLVPFNDDSFGLQSQYLMGRIYQLTGDLAAAATNYQQVSQQYEQMKTKWTEALKRPEYLREQPWERSRIDQQIRFTPEPVLQATFFSAVLGYDAGKFNESLLAFQKFAKEFPTSSLIPDVQLRIGFCYVELKQPAEAIAILTPLIDKFPRLSDQTMFWIGKANTLQSQAIPEDKPNERIEALKRAINFYRQAADRAAQLANQDPDARKRRGEFLLERATIESQALLHRESAGTFEQLLNENPLPEKKEEILLRLVEAFHMTGEYPRSEQFAQRFQTEHPQSTLMPLVLFRLAENSLQVAVTSIKRPDAMNRRDEIHRLLDDAAKRYQFVLERYPEFERVNYARFGLAMTHLGKEDHEKALAVFESIPGPDRSGDLAIASYHQADCLLRLTPTKADDALAAGMVQEKLTTARVQLEGFIAGNPKAKEFPDALLKLGYTQQQLAVLNGNPQERSELLNLARQTYEKLTQQFPNIAAGQTAILERAKCIAHMGDKNGAINELRRFTVDPLAQTIIAVPAVCYMATLYRETNRQAEAVQVLDAIRPKLEATIAKDPNSQAMLRFHHALCQLEANKLPEAKALFDAMVQVAGNSELGAEGAYRAQSLRITEQKKIFEGLAQQSKQANLKPEQLADIERRQFEAYRGIELAAQTLERRHEELRQPLGVNEARARMIYEAAWAYRFLADWEVERKKREIQTEKFRKLQQTAIEKKLDFKQPTQPIELKEVPLQPSEERGRGCYRKLIEEFRDTRVTIHSRLELAELLCERSELEAATKLLKEAVDVEPSDQPVHALSTDQIRLRLGQILASQKDFKNALLQFEILAQNLKSPLQPQGLLRSGECYIELAQFDQAVEKLKPFRDRGEFHNLPQTTDRAMLRLGQALTKQKQWDAARQAFEFVTNRFGPNSPWFDEARYQIGWSWQNQGNFDQAVNAYQQTIAGTANQWAAKSHLQIGLCRIEQKRWAEATASLLVVPFSFDFPELNPIAISEASRCLLEEKKPEQAERLLQRLIKDYPNSPQAKNAEERLTQIRMSLNATKSGVTP